MEGEIFVKRLVFHIGYPKTGTTFLQTRLFDRLDGIENIGLPVCDEFHNVQQYQRILAPLVDDAVAVDEFDSRGLAHAYIELIKNSSEKTVLCSSEKILEPIKPE